MGLKTNHGGGGGKELSVGSNLTENVIRFCRTVTVVFAGGDVAIISDSEVPSGYKCFVHDVMCRVGGATAWADGTAVIVSDTSSGPVDLFTILAAALTNAAKIGKHSSNTTMGNAMTDASGGTVDKGLRVRQTGTFTAGSSLQLTVIGELRPA